MVTSKHIWVRDSIQQYTWDEIEYTNEVSRGKILKCRTVSKMVEVPTTWWARIDRYYCSITTEERINLRRVASEHAPSWILDFVEIENTHWMPDAVSKILMGDESEPEMNVQYAN